MSETASDRLETHMTAGDVEELRKALEDEREELRQLMLRQPNTGRRENYSDGFAQGLAHAISRIDKALASKPLPPTDDLVQRKPAYGRDGDVEGEYVEFTNERGNTIHLAVFKSEAVRGSKGQPIKGLPDTYTIIIEGPDSRSSNTITPREAEVLLAELSAALSAQSPPPPSGDARIMTYEDMHEIAKGLGYPSILEALEDLDRIKAAPPSSGEAEAVAREALRQEIINTPETADFMAGVPLEAVHQRERWGADHDQGKTPWDWFWLIGYLAQKAATSAVAGDREKAKHHTISTAAALANWHAALTGADTRMAPGAPLDVREQADALSPKADGVDHAK